ncbi:MAG: hypothetical protein EOM20_14585, partial [Spartobacteria bacterium]|nr:hypothetical protein [Spartobacteria bacterium]
MNTYRQRVLSGLLCLIGALGAAQTYAQLLTVQADPLTVSSDERGRMAVWYEGTSQYYNINEKGSFLVLNDAGIRVNSFGSDLGTYPVFDAVAHSMPDSNTIETVFSPGADTGVRVHQRITCYDAARYYRITWTLTNSGATTYTDCRFLHGGDTDFGPGNISRGNWEPTRGMVFMSSTNYETTGIMGLFGGAASPSAHYHEAAWWPNWTALLMAILPDTVDPDMDDSGYGLQWNRATLAPGDSWTIDMYEKWTPPGAVQVFGPGEQACRLDTVQTNIFIVANYRDSADTFNLDVTSSLGWDLAIPGTTTVLLQAQSTTTIVTTVTVPTSLPSGRTVHFSTLHARSQGEPSLSNSDHVVSFMHIPHAPTAVNDTLCLPKGGIMDVLADGQHSLLDNDLDPEAHGLAAQDAAFNGPLHGSVDIFSDGTFLYTHNNDDAIADSFDYVAYDQQIPRLASTGHVEVSIMTVQPDNGPKAGRNVVAITGGYLGSGGDINAVSLNGFTAPIIRQSATQVIVRASYATVTGTGDVVVTSISKGTKRLRNAYTYNPPGTIFSVEPHHGPYNGGNTVTITGEALGNGTDVTNVLLCNVPAVIVDQSPTQVIVTAGPCALPGSGVVYIDSVSRGRTGRDAAYSYDPPEEANLSVSGTAEPGSAPLGSNLCYFITVSNSGPATATGVKATNTLPHQLLFMDVSSSDCI